MDEHTRICVVGAGAGGLSTAHFLKKQGYRNVTVLEKLDRVGGLCSSITYQGKSFDLGANYVTSGFPRILELAEEVGADLYTEGELKAYDAGAGKYGTLLSAITQGTSFFTVAFEALRYLGKRLLLGSTLSESQPGFKGIASAHPELCVPFGTWLDQNGMSNLKTMFSIVVTIMGYGSVDEVPAAYILTYMTLPTFIDFGMAGAGLPRIWPKRFTHGFQRLWDKLSWDLDVRLGARISRITRGDVITVDFTVEAQALDGTEPRKQTMEFDRLILATPLTLDVLGSFLHDLSDAEKTLFGKIVRNPYCVVSYETTGLEAVSAVAYVLPLTALGTPYVVTRQFTDNNLALFYVRTDPQGTITKEQVLAGIHDLASKMGGKLAPEPYTFDKWPYFPHVTSADMAAGFYDDLEALQGKKNTFYTGGLLAFELTEPIVNYSKHLVESHFPRVVPGTSPRPSPTQKAPTHEQPAEPAAQA